MSFSERSNIALSRMRKNISNSTRNALLVVLVLILTATYESAVNPPYELGEATVDGSDLSNFDPSKVRIEMDPLALSFSIFNAIDFLVTLLVTLLILPWVPYGQLLHVLLLLVFIFFVASMGLALAKTSSVIGISIFGFFALVTLILGVFIVRNKIRDRKVYRECITEFGDRVRLMKNNDIKK
ncbi:hypothetical protein COLO4_14917 [Corchorus olitorius]|uniref:PGG domain-containing protein n=1 Tax=Corchorus olitorius TaxID=93759 RepID=A0A1R3JQ76_9ROSI|nr:hypothetical protein COLO4_14917 [Corchorus olitorius]